MIRPRESETEVGYRMSTRTGAAQGSSRHRRCWKLGDKNIRHAVMSDRATNANTLTDISPVLCMTSMGRPYGLRRPAGLYQCRPSTVFGDGLDIIGKARDETGQGRYPERQTKG